MGRWLGCSRMKQVLLLEQKLQWMADLLPCRSKWIARQQKPEKQPMSNSKFNSINSANVALDFLHRTHYIDHTSYSPATSSHWRHFGSHQQVSKIGNGYRLSGQGFGVFQPDTILNRLKSIPVSLYISRMLAQCDPGVVTAARNIVRDTGRIMSRE